MKVPSPYRCDYCQTFKGQTNHWFMKLPEGPEFHTAEGFQLIEWDPVAADLEKVEHICSDSCAGKALNKWLTGVKERRKSSLFTEGSQEVVSVQE